MNDDELHNYVRKVIADHVLDAVADAIDGDLTVSDEDAHRAHALVDQAVVTVVVEWAP